MCRPGCDRRAFVGWCQAAASREGSAMSREHFIPFRATDVVSMCADELPAAERESFRAFARILTALLHHRFHARLQALKDAYHPFTPEADVRSLVVPDRAQRR